MKYAKSSHVFKLLQTNAFFIPNVDSNSSFALGVSALFLILSLKNRKLYFRLPSYEKY